MSFLYIIIFDNDNKTFIWSLLPCMMFLCSEVGNLQGSRRLAVADARDFGSCRCSGVWPIQMLRCLAHADVCAFGPCRRITSWSVYRRMCGFLFFMQEYSVVLSLLTVCSGLWRSSGLETWPLQVHHFPFYTSQNV